VRALRSQRHLCESKAGTIKNFTGFAPPDEAPTNPEIHLLTRGQQSEELAEQVLKKLAEFGIVG
jgi:bifunctional enzyme CysN/CysC